MKITLINPYEFSGPGIRSIASVLRGKGYDVQTIFMMCDTRFLIHNADGISCSKEVLDDIINYCKDSDLIGITLMTSAFNLAVKITKEIKESLDIPVIWGGVHTTIMPEESLEHADMICFGEGEISMVNLLESLTNNQGYKGVSGIWYKDQDKIIKTEIPHLIPDLDIIPYDNYMHPDDLVMIDEKIVPVTYEVSEKLIGTQVAVFFSRGCPYRCAYCCNNTINEIYKKQRIIRYRTPEKLVSEIKQFITTYKRVSRIFFNDDSFIVMPTKDMKRFCELYKEHINLPFSCQVTAPSVNDEKIKVMTDAGLNDIRVGLQTASTSMLKVYNRPISPDAVKKAANIILKYLEVGKILSYDLILDNPDEPKEATIDTLRFLLELPRPFSLRFFSLQLYPGTKLYNMVMEKEGNINRFKDSYVSSYRSAYGTYLNALLYLMKYVGREQFPISIMKFLLSKPMLLVLNTPLTNAFISLLRNIRSFWKYNIRLKFKFLEHNMTPEIKKSRSNV